MKNQLHDILTSSIAKPICWHKWGRKQNGVGTGVDGSKLCRDKWGMGIGPCRPLMQRSEPSAFT